MNYKEESTKQTTIRRLAQELLYGMLTTEKDAVDEEDTRMKEALEKFNQEVRKYTEEEAVYDCANDLVQVASEVYMERGIAEGIVLVLDIIERTDYDVVNRDATDIIKRR